MVSGLGGWKAFPGVNTIFYGLGTVLLKSDVMYTNVSQSTEAPDVGLNSLQKKKKKKKSLLGARLGWGGGGAGEGDVLEGALAACWGPTTASCPEHLHRKSSTTPVQVRAGSGPGSASPSTVWAPGGWGGGLKPFPSCNNPG